MKMRTRELIWKVARAERAREVRENGGKEREVREQKDERGPIPTVPKDGREQIHQFMKTPVQPDEMFLLSLLPEFKQPTRAS